MTMPVPTIVFDTYWRFAAARQTMYLRRLANPVGPWTDDPILANHRFTNAYRASDRVSQYLIREVQYGTALSQAIDEVFFRTILFKIFNRIETWQLIQDALGTPSWQSTPIAAIEQVLDRALAAGETIYSAAYIMPAPPYGRDRKHANHLALLAQMMDDGLPAKIAQAPSLQAVYDLLLAYPGMGRFLAFQYAIDLNYSSITDFAESDFVVAGPGAIDGISKCFSDCGGMTPEQIIAWTTMRQEQEFDRLVIAFPGLFGRRLQMIDCQNLFCEISKYARVAHPDVAGSSGRTRIKQAYRASGRPLVQPFFPPKWGLVIPDFALPLDTPSPRQLHLL